jgi:hypothetical protein
MADYTYGIMMRREAYAGRSGIFDPAVRITLARRETEAKFPLNPRGDGEGYDAPKWAQGHLFDGLTFEWYLSSSLSDSAPQYVHGPQIYYEAPYRLDLDMAKRAHKTLAHIDKAIRKAPTRDPGDFLMVMARALRLQWYAVSSDMAKRNFYTDATWKFRLVEDARDELRGIVREFEQTIAEHRIKQEGGK